MTLSIKIETIDDDRKRFNSSTRYINFKVSSKNIKTPIRAFTNGELNAKANIPSPVSINAPISIIQRQLSEKDCCMIISDNKASELLINYIIQRKQQMQHSSLIISLIQPANTGIKKLKQLNLRKKFVKLVLNIQRLAGLSCLSIPWLDYSKDEACNLFQEIIDEFEGYTIIPIIDPNASSEVINGIGKYIQNLVHTDSIKIICVIHRKIQSTLVSYESLWELWREIEALIITFNIERNDENHNDLSFPHLQEFIIGDVFASKVFPPSPKNNKKRTNIPLYLNLRVFRENSLSVPKISSVDDSWIYEIRKNIDEPLVNDQLTRYQEAENNQQKFESLGYISKVHEFLSSSNEFEKSISYIKNFETDAYIESKPLLSQVLKNRYRRTTLNDYW